ncbi:MAG: hypothetical protein ACYCUV_16120 [Phycisphaerae bacterium]
MGRLNRSGNCDTIEADPLGTFWVLLLRPRRLPNLAVNRLPSGATFRLLEGEAATALKLQEPPKAILHYKVWRHPQ